MTPTEIQENASGECAVTEDLWKLILFVAGQSPKSLMAYSNLRKVCDSHLTGRYHLQLVDLSKEPAMAKLHKIVALPTLIRESPAPQKRIIGSLSNLDKLLDDLDLGSSSPFSPTIP